MGKLGIFGGTSLLSSSLFSHLQPRPIPTPFGDATVHIDPTGKTPIVFIQRHHADPSTTPPPYRPPHMINYRANVAALVALDVDRVIAICSVGSLTSELPIGSLVLPDDYFYLFGPPVSYFDDHRAHIVPAIDPDLRAKLLTILTAHSLPTLQYRPAVYVQTTGPRFETKAEVRFLSTLGDIVGMTAATEATMTRENEIPYAIIAMVDNMAHGLAGSKLTTEQFKANVAKNQQMVETAVSHVLKKLLPA